MNVIVGSVGLSKYFGAVSPVYYTLYARNSQTDINFYDNIFQNPGFQMSLYGLGNGILIKKSESSNKLNTIRLRIPMDKLNKVLLPFPTKEEQTTIAQFLDSKTALIDQAIGIKEKQIELLKERRQILIHKSVTRGLNPDVKLKDSGVEWIGEIPEHWEVKALKYIANLQSGETISAEKFVEEGFPVFGGNGFRGYASSYTNEGEFALIGRQGALCGNVNYAKGKFYASEHAIVVYPINNESFLWLGEVIKEADFNRLSQSAAQPGIAISVIKNVLFPYPPLFEQFAIAKYIETIYAKISKTISLKEKEIEKLKEYKATLINSAVTGKIKVG
jgi:type I restriction enzyme S subunit